MHFEISEELLQKIASYLASQPFKDVVMLMNELGQLKRVDVATPATAEKKPELVP